MLTELGRQASCTEGLHRSFTDVTIRGLQSPGQRTNSTPVAELHSALI